jgi:transposase InsO family protein
LNVVDEFTRQCVGSHVARNIGARGVRAALEKMFAVHGRPAIIRSDNGREFAADSLVNWLTDQKITAAFVAKASPQQNCYVERFNGTMRDQLLNGEEFHSVTEARVVIGEWVELYNTIRPHRALKMRTPERFAAEWTAANPNARTLGSSTRPRDAHTATSRTVSKGSSARPAVNADASSIARHNGSTKGGR